MADEAHRGADALVVHAADGLELGPAGSDIDGDERGQVEARGALPAMADEIGLEAARVGRAPFAEGPHGDLGGEGGVTRAGGGEATRVAPTIGAQEPVDRRGADAQEYRAQRWGDLEDVMPLEGLDERGQEGRQPFAAEVVARFPHGPQEGDGLGAIAGRPAGARGIRAGTTAEQADG